MKWIVSIKVSRKPIVTLYLLCGGSVVLNGRLPALCLSVSLSQLVESCKSLSLSSPTEVEGLPVCLLTFMLFSWSLEIKQGASNLISCYIAILLNSEMPVCMQLCVQRCLNAYGSIVAVVNPTPGWRVLHVAEYVWQIKKRGRKRKNKNIICVCVRDQMMWDGQSVSKNHGQVLGFILPSAILE